MEVLQWGGLALGVIGIAALAMAFFRGSLGTNTIQLMEANKKAQDDAIKRLEDDSKSKENRISNLAGQIQVLKDIPLSQIAKSLELVNQIHLRVESYEKDREAQIQVFTDKLSQATADKIIQFLKGNGDVKQN